VIFGRQQLHQVRVDEQLLSTGLDLSQHANFTQLFEINRCGLPLRNAGFDDVADATVGLLEHQLHGACRRHRHVGRECR
jgi:hypothetical protein